jgi:hypothetical protein
VPAHEDAESGAVAGRRLREESRIRLAVIAQSARPPDGTSMASSRER